jgi:hypothetical protein
MHWLLCQGAHVRFFPTSNSIVVQGPELLHAHLPEAREVINLAWVNISHVKEFEAVADLEQRLGMAHQEIPVWGEQVSKLIEQLALSCLIEVDHDVSKEDDVKGTTHGPGVYEVELTERDKFPQGRNDAHQAGVHPVSLIEPVLQVG